MTANDSKRRPSNLRRFYENALSEAERLKLQDALDIEGLDEEVALLRLWLRKAIEEHPEDLQLMTKGVELLVRAVATKYRLSPKSKRDLANNLASVIENVGELLLPEAASNG
jgi:hypothetical protein